MPELRLMLIGRSGHGKSATGNTILQEERFKTCVSSTAVTSKSSLEEVIYVNYKLKVIDTPGYFDIKSSDEEVYEWMKAETMKSIALSVPGPNAFLYVLKVGRHTEEDIQSVKKLLQVFGPSVNEYMIFVFTHFNEIKDEYDTLDDYIITLPPVLSEIIHDCGNRVLAVDNRYGSEDENAMFRRQLLETIETIKGKHYTNDALKETTITIEEKIQEFMVTGNMSRKDAIKAVFSDIQSEGNIFNDLKYGKCVLASFVTTAVSTWYLLGAPVALALGFLTLAAGLVNYNCKTKDDCRIM